MDIRLLATRLLEIYYAQLILQIVGFNGFLKYYPVLEMLTSYLNHPLINQYFGISNILIVIFFIVLNLKAWFKSILLEHFLIFIVFLDYNINCR